MDDKRSDSLQTVGGLALNGDDQIHVLGNGLIVQLGRMEMELAHRCNHMRIQIRIERLHNPNTLRIALRINPQVHDNLGIDR